MSKIADRISKLIAKADASTHPEEADAFMSKAQQLMEQHGLSLLELGRLNEDPVDLQRDAISTSASYPWARKIASALSKYYGCTFVTVTSNNRVVYSIVGRESARITFTLMLPFVIKQVQALGRVAYNDGIYKSRMSAVTKIGNATAARIWSMCPATEKNEGTGPNALVPVDIMEQVLAKAFPKAAKPRASKLNMDNYAMDAAKSVSINRQATGASVKRLTNG